MPRRGDDKRYLAASPGRIVISEVPWCKVCKLRKCICPKDEPKLEASAETTEGGW